jgi:hypothetical protein
MIARKISKYAASRPYTSRMVSNKHRRPWVRLPVTLLPAIFVALVILTVVLSINHPGGTYYRIFGAAPIAAMFGMVYDNQAIIVATFLITGVPWWYLIGWIGGTSTRAKIGKGGLLLGAALAAFTCWTTVSLTASAIRQDAREGHLLLAAKVQYLLLTALCLGAIVCAINALSMIFGPTLGASDSRA